MDDWLIGFLLLHLSSLSSSFAATENASNDGVAVTTLGFRIARVAEGGRRIVGQVKEG